MALFHRLFTRRAAAPRIYPFAIAALAAVALGLATVPPASGSPPQSPSAALAVGGPGDGVGDRILGQAAFNTNATAVTAGNLNQPSGVAIAPSGRIYVVDYGNHRVLSWPNARSLRSGASADLVLGQPNFTSSTPGSTPALMNGPESVAVDSAGRVYVADSGNHRIMIFPATATSGAAASATFGSFQAAAPSPPLQNLFNFPRGLAFDSQDNLYLVDEFHDRVLVYLSPGTTDTIPDALFTGLDSPRGVAVDSQNNVYIADSENDRVLQYDTPVASNNYVADRTFGASDGTHLDCLGATTTNDNPSQTTMSCPIDVAVDNADRLYVSDIFNHRVLVYNAPLTSDTTADEVIGQTSFTSSQPNAGSSVGTAGLNTPLGMAFDDAGGLYLADLGNNRVVIYDPARALYGGNLIVNGNAEATIGSSDTSTAAPGSWRITNGNLTAVKYGVSGFPSASSPGPANRGQNFFAGGFNADNTFGEQRIDLSLIGATIDQGRVHYRLEGYFGGNLAQTDTAYMEANFQDANGFFVDQALIGMPTPNDRQNQTGLFFFSREGTVPATARQVQIALQMSGSSPYNDGYADNLVLKLRPTTSTNFVPLLVR